MATNIDELIRMIPKNNILQEDIANPNIADIYVTMFNSEYTVATYIKYISFNKVYEFNKYDDIVTNIRTSEVCELYIDNEPTEYRIHNITLPMPLTTLSKIELRTNSKNNCLMFYDVYNFKSPKIINDLAGKLVINDETMVFWNGGAK